MSDITVTGKESYFNENATFFKDVTVYGKLYGVSANLQSIESKEITVSGIATFLGNVDFSGQNVTIDFLKVNKYFSVGFGNTVLNADASTGKVGIGSVFPEQSLDISGSVKIDKDIYDSLNTSGNVGGFLSKDAEGIKWVDFEPAFSEGIFVYNNGVLIGVGSYRGLNFVSGVNTTGTSTDNIQAYVSGLNPTLADIVVSDYWGVNSQEEVYRFSNVGINTNNPIVTLDVRGGGYISSSLTIGDSLLIEKNLRVTGISTFTGITTFISGSTFYSNVGINGNLRVNSNTDIGGRVYISGITTVANTFRVTGDTNLQGNLIVSQISNFFGQVYVNNVAYVQRLFVTSTEESINKNTGSVVIEGGVGIEKNTNIGGNLTVEGSSFVGSGLFVNGETTLNGALGVGGDTILGQDLQVLGNTTLELALEVGGVADFYNDLNAYAPTYIYNSLYVQDQTTLGSNLTVFGTGFFEGETYINDILTVNGSSFINGSLNVNSNSFFVGLSTFSNTVDITGDLSVNSNLVASGLSTFVGLSTFNDNVYIDKNLYVKQDLKVQGISEFVGSATFRGGVIGIGDSITDDIVIGGEFASDLIPTTDDQYNLGKEDQQWKNLYLNGIADLDDVKIKEALYDKDDNVGYKTDKYEVPRSVLTSIPIDSQGERISGRFFDAANMIRLNLDFIAEEAVGYIISNDYKSSPTFTLSSGNYTSCKSDIKDIFKAITIDLTKGGNVQSIGAGLSYYNGNTLIHINGTDVNGYSIKEASIAAIGAAATIARYVINNAPLPKSYQPRPISGINADAARLIELNKDFIATEAVDRLLAEYPSFVVPNGNQKCINDIKLILDAIDWNIQFGGNDKVFDAAAFYITNPVLLEGEEEESIYAYERVRDVAIQVIRNATVTKVSGILNTYTQYRDLTIIGDYSGVVGVYQVAPSGIYYDSYDLIRANRQEIKDKSLAVIAISHPDFYFPGDEQTNSRSRYYDSYRLIQNNKSVIIDQAWTATAVAYPTIADTEIKCKRDLGYFVDAISTDVFTGGNKYARDFSSLYFDSFGSFLLPINEISPSVYAFNEARDLMKQAITNTLVGAAYSDLTITADPLTGSNTDPGSCADVQSNIDNLTSIVTTVIGNSSPAYLDTFDENLGVLNSGGNKCSRDIGYLIDAVATDVRDYTNQNVVGVALSYFDNGTPISNGLVGEEVESITAFHAARDLMKLAITNNLNVKDLTIAADPVTGFNTDPASCANVQSFIDNLVGIVTFPIGTGSLSTIPSIAIDCNDQASAIAQFIGIVTYAIGESKLPSKRTVGVSSIPQIRDLTLQDDPSYSSNMNPDGCANVASAIHSFAGIVTTIIGKGPSFAPNTTEPDGKIVWAPAGADSKNTIWVTKYGNDDNGGRTEGDAKLTIAAAVEISEPGDTIFVRPGVYYENNPIGLKRDVAISGQDLRLVTVVPINLGKDLFHVRRGCLVENMNFNLESGQDNPGGAVVAFPPTPKDVLAGIAYSAVSGYLEPGPADEGPSGRWRSPYVRNCTNFMNKSIGMKIDGDHATGSTIGADLKCMVLDAFTQYNEAGIGVSITNSGYAQLVSLFTIASDIAVYVSSGGQCDLTNSNSSFGNYGLYGDGLGRLEFTAEVGQSVDTESDIFTLNNVSDLINNPRRPYDGQALYFKVPVNGVPIDAPFQQLESVKVINGGSGYSAASPPNVIVRDADGTVQPKGLEGIIAEVSPTIDDATGQIIGIDVLNSGRNYLSSQNIVIEIEGSGGAIAEAKMGPIYYTISEASQPTEPNGRYADAVTLIMKNLDFIATEAVDRMLYYYNVTLGTPFSVPTGSQSCVDDIKLVLTAVSHNVQFGGNDKTYDAAFVYYTNPYLEGEEEQSIYAYHVARDLAKNIINNVTVTKQEYTSINTFDQIFDLTLVPDPLTGSNTDPLSCADVRSTIDNLVGIVTFAIRSDSPTLPNSRTIGNTVGISTVVLNEFVPYPIDSGVSVEMFRISRILASGHSFEYIGSGTDINKATPQQGGVPIKENEVVAINGAQIPYTSSDQQGNFNIGGGIQISQTTASISGRDFNRSIQAQVTPLILALS